MNINDEIHFLKTREFDAYLIKVENERYKYKTVFTDGRHFVSEGTFNKICKIIRRNGKDNTLESDSSVMQTLEVFCPWFKEYDYEVADILGLHLGSLLLELLGSSENELCQMLLEKFELSEEKLSTKVINDIPFDENLIVRTDGEKLYYNNIQYEFTYKPGELFIYCPIKDYRGGKRAISPAQRDKLNNEFNELRNFDKDGYSFVELTDKFVYFKQTDNVSPFDYERYDVFEISKTDKTVTRKKYAEICDFADLKNYENEFRKAAENDGFFATHIDFYKEQARTSKFGKIDILNIERNYIGLFSHWVKYSVDFIGDGVQYNSATWQPKNASEIITFKDERIRLSENQVKMFSRIVFQMHSRVLNNTYSAWINGIWGLVERQYLKAAVHANYKKNKYISIKVNEAQLNSVFDFLKNELNITEIKENDKAKISYYDTCDYMLEKQGIKLYSVKNSVDGYKIFHLTDKNGNVKKAAGEQYGFSSIPKSIEYELENFGVRINDVDEISCETQNLYYFVYSAYIMIEKGNDDAKIIILGDNAEQVMKEVEQIIQ